MAIQLKKAERKKVNIKGSLTGASGCGKTMSALLMAYGICGNWEEIAVIDTENESSQLYANYSKKSEGIEIGQFLTAVIEPPFSPAKLHEAIDACIAAGIKVIIIDSASHFWSKEGGILSMAGRNFQNWANVTPIEQKLWDKMLQCPAHVIACLRTKADYQTVEVEKNGKKTFEVKKIGTKPIQREDFEFEFSFVLNLESDNTFTVLKDRTTLFSESVGQKITADTGRKLYEWANTGVAVEPKVKPVLDEAKKNLMLEAIKQGKVEDVRKRLDTYQIPAEYLEELEKALAA